MPTLLAIELLSRARRRPPLGAVALLLEPAAGNERLSEILRIVHNRGHGEPLVAVGLGVAVEVLGQDGVLAVRDAVLAKIAGLHVSGHDLERAISRPGWRGSTRCTPSARTPAATSTASSAS